MRKYIFSVIFVPVLFMALVTPTQAFTQVQYYQADTTQQQINNLYSVIAQLQAQLAALQQYNQVNFQNYSNSIIQSSNEISGVVTGGVSSYRNNSVVMEGGITFKRSGKARVWFEYGTNNNLSYSTQLQEIKGDSRDTVDFNLTASDLDYNKIYYYRAVVEDEIGRYVEGAVKSFRFDGRNNDDENVYHTIADWSVSVEDNYYQTGDSLRVNYEVGEKSDKNWIGLYRVDARDSNYISYKYVRNNEGYVTFSINNEGEYEFRLFDENDDKQTETNRFVVEY